MELYITSIESDTYFQHHSITTGSHHRKETKDFTSPDPFVHWEVCGNIRIHQDLMKHQPSTSNSSKMEFKPGQPVLMKEVHGNIWKISSIDQQTKEPDSYWVRFPDEFILRRTHQMIKPRSVPSHLKLETESKEGNNSHFIPSSASRNFQAMLPDMEQPALLIGSLVTPALDEKGMSSVKQNIATSSSGVTQPSIPAVRRSAHSTKAVPPKRLSPSRE